MAVYLDSPRSRPGGVSGIRAIVCFSYRFLKGLPSWGDIDERTGDGKHTLRTPLRGWGFALSTHGTLHPKAQEIVPAFHTLHGGGCLARGIESTMEDGDLARLWKRGKHGNLSPLMQAKAWGYGLGLWAGAGP